MRNSAILLAAALALSGCATFDQAGGCGMLMPPPALDHEPVVPVLSMNLSAADVRDYCEARVERDSRITSLQGCSFHTSAGNWVRVLQRDATPERRACMKRHEGGHINGGDAQHSGWHYEV